MTLMEWYEKHKDEVFRVWYNKDDSDESCDYVYITEVIETKEGTMLGIQSEDSRYEDDRYPMREYYMLGDITLAICKSDQGGSDDD